MSIFDSVKRWRDILRGRDVPPGAASTPAHTVTPLPLRPPTPTPEELDALADAATPEVLVEASLATPAAEEDYFGLERR